MTDSTGSIPPTIRAATPNLRGPARAAADGFSLLEVAIVVVILALIAAVAIPRLSRGSQASIEAAIARDVQVLQKAIDLYAAEHNGAFPNSEMIAEQLTQYTDSRGAMSRSKSPPYTFGPYLRKVPPLPGGPNKGSSNISTSAGNGVGWIYDPTEGTITPNSTPPPGTVTESPSVPVGGDGSGPTTAPSVPVEPPRSEDD